jgi:serine/threonine-protein kinase RsbW
MNFNLRVYCQKNRLKEIREFITDSLKDYTQDELELNQLVLAVDEVCANLIIHSNACNPDELINVKVHVNDEGVTIVITDNGKSFNYKKYKEPKINEVVEMKKKGGIGLMLVKRIMDKVEFTSKDKKNTCRLYKQFKA